MLEFVFSKFAKCGWKHAFLILGIIYTHVVYYMTLMCTYSVKNLNYWQDFGIGFPKLAIIISFHGFHEYTIKPVLRDPPREDQHMVS